MGCRLAERGRDLAGWGKVGVDAEPKTGPRLDGVTSRFVTYLQQFPTHGGVKQADESANGTVVRGCAPFARGVVFVLGFMSLINALTSGKNSLTSGKNKQHIYQRVSESAAAGCIATLRTKHRQQGAPPPRRSRPRRRPGRARAHALAFAPAGRRRADRRPCRRVQSLPRAPPQAVRVRASAAVRGCGQAMCARALFTRLCAW